MSRTIDHDDLPDKGARPEILARDLAAALESAGVLAKQGNLDRAADAYREILHVHCDCVPAHARLALVLLRLRRYAAAELHFRATLAHYPTDVPTLVGLAYSLQRRARWQAAARQYRKALAVRPDSAQALIGLGVCLRSVGRMEEACDCFEHATVVDPTYVEAYHLLSTLKQVTCDDPVYARCEALQDRLAALPAIRQAHYWFALGKMREDVARYDAAFAAYEAGNRARASLFVLDESDEETWLQRTCAAFDAKRLADHPLQSAEDGRVPVFVVGMPRSGTSLIEQILATHPRVHGAGEIPDLQDVLTTRLGAPEDWAESVASLSRSELRELGAAYIERVWYAVPAATHVVNKMTLNYRYIGLIRMILPQARIIHARRDPMDCCFSCYTHLFDGDNLAYTYDLGALGRYYDRHARWMRHWHEVLPDALLDVHYEDMVDDTEAQVRRMLEYLGLPWEPRCLEFHRNRRVVETASRVQVRRPVYRSSIARWRRFEAHLQPLLGRVAPWC